MQDLLSKIISMDEKARQLQEEHKQQKLESEKEIEQLRETIYNDYIERAKERIEENIAVDQKIADTNLENYKKTIEQAKADMTEQYNTHKDEWVDTIVERVLS